MGAEMHTDVRDGQPGMPTCLSRSARCTVMALCMHVVAMCMHVVALCMQAERLRERQALTDMQAQMYSS